MGSVLWVTMKHLCCYKAHRFLPRVYKGFYIYYFFNRNLSLVSTIVLSHTQPKPAEAVTNREVMVKFNKSSHSLGNATREQTKASICCAPGGKQSVCTEALGMQMVSLPFEAGLGLKPMGTSCWCWGCWGERAPG